MFIVKKSILYMYNKKVCDFIPRREIKMKRMLKIILILVGLLVLGCSSSKDVVNIPVPTDGLSIRFVSLHYPTYELFGFITIVNQRTGDYVEVFKDDELKDFIENDTEYEITWKTIESGTTNVETHKYISFKMNPIRTSITLALGTNDYEIIPQ